MTVEEIHVTGLSPEDFEDPDDEEEEPICSHCGKPLYDFSDLGCGRCDRRSPEWGILP